VKSKLLQRNGTRNFVIALESGDRLIESITRFGRQERLAAAEFTAIGALASAKLAYFNWETKDYDEIRVDEQVELLSLNGRVTLPEGSNPDSPDFDGDPHLHVHCVLGRRDGTTVGGHLMEAEVRPTCEVFLNELPTHLTRRKDPESGLPLIDPEA
jgi:predicted DNA-binding protein with PD1-like motif